MLTDESQMPFGKHKGTKMADVPASYLLWLEEKISPTVPSKRTLQEKEIVEYIQDNKQVLIKENSK